VQEGRDVVFRDGVPVGREAAFECTSGLPLASAPVAEAELFWESRMVGEGPDFEAEFGGEEGEEVEGVWL
jgi:hypothetical protein